MPDVIALGDVNVDIIARFDQYPAKGGDALAHSTEFHCGGSAANTAMALASMGLDTLLIARLGPDPWAPIALEALATAGVRSGGIQQDPTAMTGLMYIVVTPDGERTIIGHRGANVLTAPGLVQEPMFSGTKLFHLSGYALLDDPQRSAALRAFDLARTRHVAISLDPGMTVSQAALDEMRSLLPSVSILLPTISEARKLTGQMTPAGCAELLLARGVEVVALKLGRDGCLIATEKEQIRIPAFTVKVMDSTGAGDSFAAGLIAGRLAGLDWSGAGLLGNALGAVTSARVGAGGSSSLRQEVLALLGDACNRQTHSDFSTAIARAMEILQETDS